MSESEIRVLDRGLKFAPVQNMNKFDTYVNIHKFVRNVNMKKYFLSNPSRPVTTTGGFHSTLRNKSTFNPLNTDNKYLEVFKNMLFNDLDKMKVRKAVDPLPIRQGMKSPEKRNDIIIHPADKGGGLVILDKSKYLEELHKLLEDRETYQILNKDPMLVYKDELHWLIEEGKSGNILTKKEASYLDPFFCKTPIIYCLPKIHKDMINPPGRPIVNGIDSISSWLGQYIDHFLQPLVCKTDAFLKDTKHIIQTIESTRCSPSSIMVTGNVGSLYTIIGHEDALSSVQ